MHANTYAQARLQVKGWKGSRKVHSVRWRGVYLRLGNNISKILKPEKYTGRVKTLDPSDWLEEMNAWREV